jgi:tRNA(Ser,Leu) C12 N-acetylase TAN1
MKGAMQDYNVLVTFHHNERWKAEEEVADRIKEAGLSMEDLMESSVPGLLMVRVTGDGKEAVKKLRGFAFRFPELFHYTHRWTPVEEWVSSEPDEMLTAAKVFGERIKNGDRWRMDIEKRHYQGGSTLDLVKTLTKPIDRGVVDLEKPEVVIKVEIIGDFAGFALVSEEEVLDVNEVRSVMGVAKIY